MRGAPPVRMSVGGQASWRVLEAFVPALAAGTLALWLLQRGGVPPATAWPVVLGVALPVLAWAWARHGGRAGTRHDLAWDGAAWTLDRAPCRVQVMMDLDRWLLLKVQPASDVPALWVPLSWPSAGADRPLARAALRHMTDRTDLRPTGEAGLHV